MGVFSSRISSTGPYLVDGYADYYGIALARTFELWTGSSMSVEVAAGLEGLEVLPSAVGLDTTSAGWPVIDWSVCESGGAMGCAQRSDGIGGPGEPNLIERHACDRVETLSIGPDGGVYLVSEDPESGGERLERRHTIGG
jgi:hypothetical protein